MNFLEELRWRGMLHNMTDGLEEALSNHKMMTAYIGYDPTAPSITIGNYVTIMMLKLFQQHGHKPIVLMGGATGRIGDPSFKEEERNLLDFDVIDRNLKHQRKQMENLLDFSENLPNKAEFVDNYDFYSNMNALEFLRDVGKTITVNYMMSKDSVKTRFETGISFTEFSYQVLQGYDFVHLYRSMGCTLQMGGSDQWGNITTGTHMIGKMIDNAKAYAVTCPLLTKADGTKFGKSEKGNIWLDGDMTSSYEFYQYWFNAGDEEVVKYNRYFSLKSPAEIEALEAAHAAAIGQRVLQKSLAEELTGRIHGAEGLQVALEATAFFFDKKMSTETLNQLPAKVFEIASTAVDSAELPAASLQAGLEIGELLAVITKFMPSKSEVRRAIKSNAIAVNKQKLSDELYQLTPKDVLPSGYILIENGKKTQYLIKVK
jgi:tyrosyl-tRNA synthetase